MDVGEILARIANPGEPPLIAQLSRVNWAVGVVQVAIRLEVFTVLKGTKLNSAGVASLLGANHRYTEGLLNACVSVGLLEKIGDEYLNTKESGKYLVKGDPKYYGDCFTYWQTTTPLFDQADSAVLTGTPVPYEPEFSSEEEEAAYWRHYMLAMHQLGKADQEDFLLENIDLTGKKKLLDIAGGSGVYTIAFCQKYPDLTAVLFDLERALPYGRSFIEAEGLSRRISTIGGDFNVDAFGMGYDVALISGVLCLNSLETSRRVFRKAYESMVSGGLIIIQDNMRIGPYTETTPCQAVASFEASIFYGGEGGVHSADEMVDGLTSVGFTSAKQIVLPAVYSLVTALKP